MSGFDSQWFYGRLADLDMSQRAFSKLMGQSTSAVNRLLKGTRRWQLDDVRLAAEILGVPASEVSARVGVPLPGDSGAGVPISGVVDASGAVGPLKAGMGRRADRPPLVPDNGRAVRVVKPGAPTDNWILYYAPSNRLDPEAVGRLAIAELANKGGLRVGVLSRGYKAGHWNLRSLTDPADELADVEINWANPVLWIKS